MNPGKTEYGARDLARMLVEYAAQRNYLSFEPTLEDDENVHILYARVCALAKALGFTHSPHDILNGSIVIIEKGERDPVVFHELLEATIPEVKELDSALAEAVGPDSSHSWSGVLDCNRALMQFFSLRRRLYAIEAFNDDWFACRYEMNMTNHSASIANHLRDANAHVIDALDSALAYLLDPQGRMFSRRTLIADWQWPTKETSIERQDRAFDIHHENFVNSMPGGLDEQNQDE